MVSIFLFLFIFLKIHNLFLLSFPRTEKKLIILQKGPFRDYSQITVYHPATGYGHAFANVGFTGFIG